MKKRSKYVACFRGQFSMQLHSYPQSIERKMLRLLQITEFASLINANLLAAQCQFVEQIRQHLTRNPFRKYQTFSNMYKKCLKNVNGNPYVKVMYRVFRKNCVFFTIHSTPPSPISLEETFKALNATRVYSHSYWLVIFLYNQ